MPQMAPLSWLTLYIVFSFTLIMFCILNYFMFIPAAPKTPELSHTATNSMNWKW